MKKIIFMRGYFYPETAASNLMCLDLIKKLSEDGFNVVVYCPVPTRGVDDKIRKKYKKKKKEKIFPNVTVIRYWLPREKKQVIFRVFRYLLQNFRQLLFGLTHSYDALFMYSTPPTNGIVGGIISKIKKVPFYYYLHDIFPDSLLQSGMTTNDSMVMKIGREIEQFTYKNAKIIFVISNSMIRNIIKKGVSNEKIELVYNWVNIENIHHVSREQNCLIDTYNIPKEKFIVTYAGNIGEAQSVETLIEAARILKTDESIYFVIIGNGAREDACKKYAEGLKNIIFLPMQNQKLISEVYSLGDISTVLCRKGVGTSGMPSKIGSIMATGTPLLAAFDKDSDLCEIINKYKAGVCVEPESPEKLADAIKLLKNASELRKKYTANATDFLHKNMTDKVCTDKISNLLNNSIVKEEIKLNAGTKNK